MERPGQRRVLTEYEDHHSLSALPPASLVASASLNESHPNLCHRLMTHRTASMCWLTTDSMVRSIN